MALPLLFFIGSSLIRAATPVIAKMLVKQGYKRASGAVVKNALKNSKKIRTIGSKKDIPIAKSKSLTIPKNQSTALTKINKTTGGNKSKLVNGKVVTAATTIASIPALLAKKDDKKGQAKADTKKKVLPGRMEGGPPQRKGTTSTATAMTFGKAFRAAKDAGKKEFTYKGKKYHTRTKDEDKKTTSNQSLPKSRPNTEKKLDKKVEKKTPNYGGAQTIPKKEDKKKEEKKSKGFLDRVKDDLKKAVKETKRNFSDKRYFVNGVDSRKEKIKSKSNIKQKK
jgi:hypothetical protein|tara:strand:- start:973 stop:1812 length:840 start_codon:yes stop_codon:yes gene_type:complete